MLIADALCYLAQALAATLYAILLEGVLKRRYEPNWTWATVVGGVAMVGLIVAGRLAWGPLPALDGRALAWWVWLTVFWSFCAAAVPIIVWQLILQHRRLGELLALVRRHG